MDIRAIAKKATTLAEIMTDRDKIDTETIIQDYETITIDNIELCQLTKDGKTENVWAYTFKENPDVFAFAGYILSKIFDEIVKNCNGDLEEAYKAVRVAKLKVKLTEGRTKSKQQVTMVEVL